MALANPPKVKRRKPQIDQYPLFEPITNWIAPTELPDLSNETEIAIDTETRDPKLAKNEGPGFIDYVRADQNTGYICGVSMAWRDQKIYVPVNHRRTTCFDFELVQRWLKATTAQARTKFVFHNFQYDWGWIQAVFGLKPPALIDDTMAMASMIDENLDSFKLDFLCHWQGLPGKDESLLLEALENYGVRAKEAKQYLWALPAKDVGPYAEQDALSTLQLAAKLRPILKAEDLEEAYKIECDLMPVTLRMKQHGIRVDVAKAKNLITRILQDCREEEIKLGRAIGTKVTIKELRSHKWLEEQFNERGLEYPRTAATARHSEGQASFEKTFMKDHYDPFPRAVFRIKHMTDFAEKFLDKFIVDYASQGRVYPTVNQFRSEEGGARSHRFSYSDPPMQQMPSRDDELAPLIRGCFIPEDGDFWCSIDYRQQEFRLMVYVGEMIKAPGAKEAADMYRMDPKTDFHDYVASITRLPRRRAKDVNFAVSYGAGKRKFSVMTGMSEEEAGAVMDQYNEHLPFIRNTSDRYNKSAAYRGYIKMIDGARGHFNLWEPNYRDFALERMYKERTGIAITPCHHEEAVRRKDDPNHPWYGEPLKRAYTHKAFNRMIQGSAARQIKKAMVEISKAGYHTLLQLHDELCFSFNNIKDAEICSQIMQEAVPKITIPMSTDVEVGPNWGELKKYS